MTKNHLRKIYDYLPTGQLKKKNTGRVMKGCALNHGHLITTVPGYGGKRFLIHRLIYVWHKGKIPFWVDHIDRNPKNNRIENLRAADRSSNVVNCKRRAGAKFKYIGIRQHVYGRYYSQICKNGIIRHLGTFNTQIEAAKAYDKAARKFHGEFACTNF